MRPCILTIAICALLNLSVTLADETGESKPPTVRYGERPLTGADFWAPVPNKRPVDNPRAEAYSHTEVHYTFDSRTRKRNRKFRAELQDIQFFCLFSCEKSWNALPDDQRLLEHHEGHFDITQIVALQLQLEWREKIAEQKLFGEGKTERAAVAALEKKIGDNLQSLNATLQREHDYFDQATRYGTDLEKEALARKKHQQQLKELGEQVADERDSERASCPSTP